MKSLAATFIVLILSSSLSALSITAGDTVAITQHEHSMLDNFFGEGDDEFVCYNKVHRNFYSGIFASVVALMVITYSRYRIKRKSSIELSKKNLIIEEKNKDILDSIHYAKRIQSAIMPSEKSIRTLFSDFFILYMPKDIVSGDFYWASSSGKISMIAAVDCTGHGVPGAFLSIIGNNALNKATSQLGHVKPDDIMRVLHKEVTDVLHQNDQSEVKDGMDITLCSLDRESNTLYFAGANNPLYVISKGELKEYKSNKFSIGLATDSEKVNQVKAEEIKMQKGDSFYIFSDGYSDQFGGPNGKKFKSKSLQKALLSASEYGMDEQKKLLKKAIEDWKGSMEQVDDILVIGVRV